MSDHYDEMSVHPDPSLAEPLRQRLHARLASVAGNEHEHRSPHHHLERAPVGPDEQPIAMKEIDVTRDAPTSETRDRRRLVITAAAVLAVIGAAAIAVAINDTSAKNDQTQSPATATTVPPATTVERATTLAPTTSVAPRVETVRFSVTSANIPVTFTVPDDWTVEEGFTAYTGGFGAGGITGVLFDEITNIYTDGCRWTLAEPPVGPTVDDLVTAWTNVPELAPTAAIDITVDGHAGKQIELTVPDYTRCSGNKFGLWQVPGPGTTDSPGYWAQGPNQHNQILILDVDGTRLVILAESFPTTSPQDRAALDEVMASIQIG
jgi:hypothetical protein